MLPSTSGKGGSISALVGNPATVSVSTQGQYNLVLPTYTDGQNTVIQTDNRGRQLVVIDALGGLAGQQLMAASLPVVIASNQSNLPENITQIAGAAVLAGNGVTGTGSLRVTVASDNTPYAVKIQDSAGNAITEGQQVMAASLPVVIASNQTNVPTNVAQINAVTPLMGNGVTGTGSQRVTVASDNTPFAVKIQDSSGNAITEGQQAMAASLPVVIASNQTAVPENITQVNGVAVLAGNGVTGTGSLRVTVASDNTPFAVKMQDSSGNAIVVGQQAMAASVPVVIASNQTALPVTPTYLDSVDEIDNAVGPVLDTSVNNIQDNAGTFLTLVASLAANVKRIKVADTTGEFLGIYTGAAASEVLKFIVNPGQSIYQDVVIAAGVRISVRSMGSAVISTGKLLMEFTG